MTNIIDCTLSMLRPSRCLSEISALYLDKSIFKCSYTSKHIANLRKQLTPLFLCCSSPFQTIPSLLLDWLVEALPFAASLYSWPFNGFPPLFFFCFFCYLFSSSFCLSFLTLQILYTDPTINRIENTVIIIINRIAKKSKPTATSFSC